MLKSNKLNKLKLNIKKLMADMDIFLYQLFYCKLFKEDELMMAMLWANQIMLGKKQFSAVPRLLKESVRELLIDAGMEHLVTE